MISIPSKTALKIFFALILSAGLAAIVFLSVSFLGKSTLFQKTPSVFLSPERNANGFKPALAVYLQHPSESTSSAQNQVSEAQNFKIPILMYHYVENVQNPADTLRQKLDVNPSEFDRQLTDLGNEGFQTLFVKEIPDLVSGKTPLPPKTVVLTFDDGYADFYQEVLPLLKKHKMKATLYVIYDFIDHPDYVTAEQIKEIIASNLVEIGSHTLNHTYLKTASAAESKRQITESKKRLETDFGITIETFAYPYGAFNSIDMEYVRAAGYTAAVSTQPGTKQSGDNLYSLSRLRATNYIGVNPAKTL